MFFTKLFRYFFKIIDKLFKLWYNIFIIFMEVSS